MICKTRHSIIMIRTKRYKRNRKYLSKAKLLKYFDWSMISESFVMKCLIEHTNYMNISISISM